MNVDLAAYNINIRRVSIDGEDLFEARVKELPDVIAYSETADDAYAMAMDAVEATAEHFNELGKSMPVPSVPVDDYSGRVTLRLPKSLHQVVAETAESEGISLNQHLVGVISWCSGVSYGRNLSIGDAWISQGRGDRVKKSQAGTSHLKLVSSFDSPEKHYAIRH